MFDNLNVPCDVRQVNQGRLRFRLSFSILGCGKYNANFRK